MDDDKNISITYETLFEFLRNEKNRDELQKLSPTFLNDVSLYLAEKQGMLKSSQSSLNLFSEEEREKASTQLVNIKRILKELYERRERKIINMALNKSRTNTNIIDTSLLLEKEKAFFEEVTAIFSKQRNDMLTSLFESSVYVPPPKEKDEQTEEEDEGEDEESDQTEEKQEAAKLVRFLHAVPKFMGKELEVYGPFDEEDVASLPAEIADLLIKKGRVEELSGD